MSKADDVQKAREGEVRRGKGPADGLHVNV